jgi:transposase-like protein
MGARGAGVVTRTPQVLFAGPVGVPFRHGSARFPCRSCNPTPLDPRSFPQSQVEGEPMFPDSPPIHLSSRGLSEVPPVHTTERLRQTLHLARLARGTSARPGLGSVRPTCPRCGSRRVHRWGSFSGRQRHRCTDCRRTFSDFTGSPFWHSRKVGSWLPYLDCMAAGVSLRIAAGHCDVSLATAFRRRHHILRWRTGCGPSTPLLQGDVALEEVRIPESFKGSRRIPRAPRSHAVPWGRRTIEGRRSLVLVLHSVRANRGPWPLVRGHASSCGVFSYRPDPSRLQDELRSLLHPGAVIHAPVRRGWKGWPGQPRSKDTWPWSEPVEPLPALGEEVGPAAHAAQRGARNLRRRLRKWLLQFRGIATRHLPGYLTWFNAWSHGFPTAGGGGVRPPDGEDPARRSVVDGSGLRLLATLLTPQEADP